jgi:hypothetical protein
MKPEPLGRAHGIVTGAAQSDTVVGFAAGSPLLTLDGAIPVEFLSPGDRVITRDAGMAILRDLHRVEATCEMVAILAGTLGHTRPEHDTILPGDQKVLLRDWRAQALFGAPQALAPARRLIDGEFIRLAGRQTLTLFQLVFDAPHILYVDGLELACELQIPAKYAA